MLDIYNTAIFLINMTSCQATTRSNEQCSRNALKSGYCFQHDKDAQILMFKKELARMHHRVRRYTQISNDLNSKILDIQKLDFIKAELARIGGSNKPYRGIIDNQCYRTELESLFDIPFRNIPQAYDELLKRRNKLVHPYSVDDHFCKYGQFK